MLHNKQTNKQTQKNGSHKFDLKETSMMFFVMNHKSEFDRFGLMKGTKLLIDKVGFMSTICVNLDVGIF